MNNYDIHVRYAPWERSIQLFFAEPILGRVSDGGIGVIGHKPLFIVADGTYDPATPQESSLSIATSTAQSLMDQLWNCGLRPTEGSGSAGALSATQRHLEDMRRIAFNKLNENETTGQSPR